MKLILKLMTVLLFIFLLNSANFAKFNFNSFLNLIEIYEEQVDEAIKSDDEVATQVALKNLSEQITKIERILAEEKLAKKQKILLYSKLNSIKSLINKGVKLSPTYKNEIGKLKGNFGINYGSYTGIILNGQAKVGETSFWEIFADNEIGAQVSDAMAGITTFTWNANWMRDQFPIKSTLFIFSDAKTPANSNTLLDLSSQITTDLFFIKKATISTKLHNIYQIGANINRIDLNIAKNMGKYSYSMGIITNFAEIPSFNYQQLTYTYKNIGPKILGADYNYNILTNITNYNINSKANVAYFVFDNTFSKNVNNINSKLIWNYTPYDITSAYFHLKNSYRKTNGLYIFNDFILNYDIKSALNTSLEYSRLGGTFSLPWTPNYTTKINCKFDLNFYNYSLPINSYTQYKAMLDVKDNFSLALIDNYKISLERRMYVAMGTSRWDLDFSTRGWFSKLIKMNLNELVSASFTKYDVPTSIQKDALLITARIDKKIQNFMVNFNLSLNMFINNFSANSLIFSVKANAPL